MMQAIAVMAELQRLSGLTDQWDWSRTAIIARDWKSLEPVRSYCELHGLPVQMADEEMVPFWRLRETQRLVGWLRQPPARRVDAPAIHVWLAQQGSGRWWALLHEAIQQYSLETSNAELPIDHCIEWLAEWGREVRRRQTGLLLLTAHRAKGLEFDHVAVLDGNWDRVGHGEDPDAPRRLFYVAMTRARQTLLLARLDRHKGLLDTFGELPGLLRRAPTLLPAPTPQLARRYQYLTMKDVNIGFAGRHALADPIHQAIAALAADDPLHLRQVQQYWELHDNGGNTVGRLSRAFSLPPQMRCLSARVAAIVVGRSAEADPEFQRLLQCTHWEVVLPELVFEPQH
jgi:ATP-dependent DNA helicase RecQ